jgi:hypothetical protein
VQEVSEVCPQANQPHQPMQYAVVVPNSGSSQLVGRLRATQPAGSSGTLQWQRFFQLAGSVMQLDIDMGTGSMTTTQEPMHSVAAPPAAVAANETACMETVPSAAALPAQVPKPDQIKLPVAALDRSMMEFMQAISPKCPAAPRALIARAPRVTAAAAAAPTAVARATERAAAAAADLFVLLPPALRLLLRSEAAVLGLSSACLLELALVVGLLLRRPRQPAAQAQAAAAPAAAAAKPAQQAAAQQTEARSPSLKKALRDACCSPMVATSALLRAGGSALNALSSGSPSWGRARSSGLAAVPENDGAQEAVGWSRQVCLGYVSNLGDIYILLGSMQWPLAVSHTKLLLCEVSSPWCA